MKRVYVIATAIILSVALTSCGGRTTKTQETDAVETVLTKTAKVVRERVAQTEDFTANLLPYKRTFITSSMPLRIDKIYVEVDDVVKEGDLLVSMDRNQYNQNNIQLKNAQLNLDRLKTVFSSGGISQSEIDNVEAQVFVFQEADKELKKSIELRSTMNGIVTGRYNEEGDLFTMGGNADGGVGILQIMQINPLKAIVAVSEQYYPFVKKGMPINVRAEVYSDVIFKGEVNLVYPAINSATRTFNVEIVIPNAEELLRPGMFARTTFNMGDQENLVIPDVAILKQSGVNDKFVYVIKNGVAERRVVILGRHIDNKIEVLSGLKEGEEIAITGLSRLKAGVSVKVVK